MRQYSKAIVGALVPVLAIGLMQLAENYGLPLDVGVAGILSTVIVGLLTGAAVWAVRNAPPDLIEAIEDAAGIEIDEAG